MQKIPVTITEEQFITGLRQVRRRHHKLAFVLGFYQCMRVSEVINLNPEDIDFSRGFIHIKQGKGNKDRMIPITKESRKLLKYVPITTKIQGHKARISRQALNMAVKRYWPNLHFHSLRHSGATHYLVVKKVGTRQLQQFLGHSRLDTTQIYTHITPQNLKDLFS